MLVDANPSPAKRLLEQQRIAEADAVGRAEVEKVAAASLAQRFENEEILTILRGRIHHLSYRLNAAERQAAELGEDEPVGLSMRGSK